jgi:rubrerythrin
LQELDFDQALGKIPEEDYQARRAELMLSGADVLRKLDEHGQSQPVFSAEDRLEAAVAARRADASAPGAPRRRIVSGSDEEEELIAARHRSRIEKAAGFCPQCGKPVQKSDRFCPRCGASI